MRPSLRTTILDAAIRVTERGGITSLTLESAAAEAGVTKGGLMYHFPTRSDLLVAIQQHLAASWELRLTAELGKSVEQATPQESIAAYVHVGVEDRASKADLAFMIESVSQPELAEIWDDLLCRWAPLPTTTAPADIDLLLARLAADGLWLFEATSSIELSNETTKALQARLLSLIAPHKSS